MYCKDCKFYKVNRVDGPYCTKGAKHRPVSPLLSNDCFEEPSGDDDVQAILASVPDMAVEAPVEKPKRRGGRPKSHPNYVDENGVTMKWCRVCQQYKPIDEFGKKSSAADGHTYECKKCKVDHQRKKRDEKRQSRPAPEPKKKQPEVIIERKEKKDPVLGWVSRDDNVTDTYVKVPVINPSCCVNVSVAYNPGDRFVTVIIRTSDEKKGMDI